MTDFVAIYGWTAQSRDPSVLLNGTRTIKPPKPQTVESIPLPSSPLAKTVLEYAKQQLSEPTFNHSMRVYYYGQAIQTQHFPAWPLTAETYLLTCLLHDIGTTDKNLAATLLSFEFYGGYIALDLLKRENAPVEQAESVAEAVIRHQDLGQTGTISTLGMLIQLATVFDNMGDHAQLVHPSTIEDVVRCYPRQGWSKCFAGTIRKENALKPWAHTTKLGVEDFPRGVEGNQLMAPYDG